jgi:O-methyltransferase
MGRIERPGGVSGCRCLEPAAVRIRRGPGTPYRRWQSVRFLVVRDRQAVLAFMRAAYPVPLSLPERWRIVRQFMRTTNAVRAYHTQTEMLTVADAILRRAGQPDLTVVECGACKGGSTAKLSLVTRIAGGHLHVFDSFQGMPANDERDAHLDGRPVAFFAGAFRGRLSEVQRNVARFGALEVCTLHKGWFADTLPRFRQQVDVALLDVDLASSTRTCVAALYPQLRPGGVLFSQDGHLRGSVEVLRDESWWAGVGAPRPEALGLGRDKLIALRQRPSLRRTGGASASHRDGIGSTIGADCEG